MPSLLSLFIGIQSAVASTQPPDLHRDEGRPIHCDLSLDLAPQSPTFNREVLIALPFGDEIDKSVVSKPRKRPKNEWVRYSVGIPL